MLPVPAVVVNSCSLTRLAKKTNRTAAPSKRIVEASTFMAHLLTLPNRELSRSQRS